jgi:hypothetical protein
LEIVFILFCVFVVYFILYFIIQSAVRTGIDDSIEVNALRKELTELKNIVKELAEK